MSIISEKLKKIHANSGSVEKMNKWNFKKKKTIFTVIFLAVAVTAGIIFVPRAVKTSAALKNSETTQQTYTVRKGDISTTVTGSGPIVSANREEITSKIEGKINAIYFKEGDTVKAGDLLVEIDDTDVKSTISQIQSNVVQQQINYQNAIKDLNSLTITAPFDGMVKDLNVNVGDEIGKKGTVLTLVDTSKLKTQLTFAGSIVNNIKAGQKVNVYSQDFMDIFEGTVTYVSDRPYSTSSGGALYTVEIEVINPGALQEGMSVNADIDTLSGTVSSINSGTLSYVNKAVLKSSAGGTVTSVNVRQNGFVKKGDVLVKLENTDAEQNKIVIESKLNDLNDQLKSAMEKLNYCRITAPFDGMIVKQGIKVGQSLRTGDSIVTVVDTKNMEFSVPIDELDIQKVKVGQEAKITIDALSETQVRPLSGTVTKIATEGTSVNGVTTYPVTIKVDEPNENIKGGMNASAEIFITNKKDVLYVPIQAVMRIGGKNYVMLKGDAKTIEEMKKNGTYIDIFNSMGSNGNQTNNQNRSTQRQNSSNSTTQRSNYSSSLSNLSKYKDYYADAIPTLVEIGANTASSIEITNGLKEGDVVILPPVSTSSTNQSNQNQVRIPMEGGFQMGGAQQFRNSSRN